MIVLNIFLPRSRPCFFVNVNVNESDVLFILNSAVSVLSDFVFIRSVFIFIFFLFYFYIILCWPLAI